MAGEVEVVAAPWNDGRKRLLKKKFGGRVGGGAVSLLDDAGSVEVANGG